MSDENNFNQNQNPQNSGQPNETQQNAPFNGQSVQPPVQPPYQGQGQPVYQTNYQGSNPADVQNAVNAAMQEQKKKKRKKRLIILAVIIAVIVVIAAVAGAGSSDDDKANTAATVAASVQDDAQTTSAVKADSDENVEGKIGDYVCTVKSAKLCKNWDGKDSVMINYSFTNNSSDSQSFDIALADDVYQDGVSLEDTFISSDGEEDDWGVDVKIKPGKTKEVKKVYILRDKTTPLEVEIGELISFDDTKVTTTVEISK